LGWILQGIECAILQIFPEDSINALALEILVAFFGMTDYNVNLHAGGRKIKWENLNTPRGGA
jgi:hypothetical protein